MLRLPLQNQIDAKRHYSEIKTNENVTVGQGKALPVTLMQRHSFHESPDRKTDATKFTWRNPYLASLIYFLKIVLLFLRLRLWKLEFLSFQGLAFHACLKSGPT